MKFQKKQKQDRRINAPFISWKVLLILYLILYCLIIAQYFIIKGLGENKGVMISVIVFYGTDPYNFIQCGAKADLRETSADGGESRQTGGGR